MQGLIGKKVGMTRIFDEAGRSIAVTVIETGKNVVHQVKTIEKDGYSAAQLGFQEVDEKKTTKPRLGHFKKLSTTPTKVIREFKLDQGEQVNAGQKIGVEILENVKYVDIIGTSKGRGHTGTIKRYNFERGRETHGNTNVRERGSSGANTFPARVFPGLRMSGHMGAERVTIKKVKVIALDKESGLVFVEGSIPGFDNAICYLRKNITKQSHTG